MTNIKQLSACPQCGFDEFYRKGHVKGRYTYSYRFDGEPAYNTELHDGIKYVEGKRCYCVNCHLYLGIINVSNNFADTNQKDTPK